MLSKYRLIRDLIIEDRGTGLDNRFNVVDTRDGKEFGHLHYERDRYDVDNVHYLHFNKGEIYNGADRTELGQYLIKNNLVEKISDEAI